MQILYQLDFGPASEGSSVDAAILETEIERYWASFEPVTEDVRAFAERLARGVAAALPEIDRAIAGVSQRWKLGRMDKVDRNVLRLAAFEILRCPDIPRAASINEAIEIAKRFSGSDSASFINGILDQLHGEGEA